MSRQEGEPANRPRARANTTSFGSFSWTKSRRDPISPPEPIQVNPPTLSLEALVQALSPPAVPSLAHARSLATILSNCSPLPRRETLDPILISLCNDAKFPPSVQAAGYDILSAYWENHESMGLTTAERLSYLSLFLGNSTWGMELWEPKFKALRALTRYGAEITGIENDLIGLLQNWIKGAFEGLLKSSASTDRAETAERERSMELLVKFLSEIMTKQQNASRIRNTKVVEVLDFYGSLVDICVSSVDKDYDSANIPSTSSSNVVPAARSHRRNTSSVSSSSPSPATSSPQGPTSYSVYKHAAEFATGLYLNHFLSHVKTLPPTHLNTILPLLFRALAFCDSPLPRLSVLLQSKKKDTVEEKISETLNDLFSGHYATACMLILRTNIFPPTEATSSHIPSSPFSALRLELMTSLGAHRTLRNYVRRALSARLARAYISRETSIGYSHSGAPGHMELHGDLMEKAWPKDDYSAISIGNHGNGWDAARLGKTLANSVTAWINYRFDDSAVKSDAEKRALWDKEKEGKEEVLEEAASVVNDILRELDLRDDDNSLMDEEEARVVGLIILRLTDYVRPLK